LCSNMNLPPYVYPIKNLVVSDQTGKWCQLPYPGHPLARVEEYFDLSWPLFLVHSEFDLVAHVERMRTKFPEWTDKQLRCVLYWQNVSRKQLKERVAKAAGLLGTNTVATIPEAMGVNVYATASFAGLKLERIRSLKICRHVALIGTQKYGQLKMF